MLFFGQLLNFVIAVVNIRAASKGMILLTGGSDFLFCVVNILLISHIVVGRDWREVLAYATGGAVGSMIAMKLTQRWD